MKRRRKKNNNKIILIIVSLVIIFCCFMTISYSKYIYHAINDYYLGTKGFYFNSDKLSKTHSEFEVVNNWSGAESKTIIVNLNSKKNDLVFASSDISYTITYTKSDNINCTISKSNGVIPGSAGGGINEDYFVITIEPAGGSALPNGSTAWVDIEVKSTAPYEDTLSGKLIVGVGTADITHEIMDSANAPYLEVSIVNSLSEDKDVTLTFDPNVILLDMTSSFKIKSTNITTQAINAYQYVKTVTAEIKSLETTTVKFYKVDPTQDYSYHQGDTGTPKVTISYNQ